MMRSSKISFALITLFTLMLFGAGCGRKPQPVVQETAPLPGQDAQVTDEEVAEAERQDAQLPVPPISLNESPPPIPPTPPSPPIYPLNCGTDEDCINYHIAKCTANATWEAEGFGAVYAYKLKGKIGADCAVEQKFTANPIPAFVGPTMTCNVPTASLSEFAQVQGEFFAQNNYARCSGPLKQAFTDPGAFLGQ